MKQGSSFLESVCGWTFLLTSQTLWADVGWCRHSVAICPTPDVPSSATRAVTDDGALWHTFCLWEHFKWWETAGSRCEGVVSILRTPGVLVRGCHTPKQLPVPGSIQFHLYNSRLKATETMSWGISVCVVILCLLSDLIVNGTESRLQDTAHLAERFGPGTVTPLRAFQPRRKKW